MEDGDDNGTKIVLDPSLSYACTVYSVQYSRAVTVQRLPVFTSRSVSVARSTAEVTPDSSLIIKAQTYISGTN